MMTTAKAFYFMCHDCHVQNFRITTCDYYFAQAIWAGAKAHPAASLFGGCDSEGVVQ